MFYSPSSSSATSPIVPFVANTNVGPKVAPLSVDTLATGSFAVWFLSHHVTITFPPSAAISASTDSASVVLLRLILSLNVAPPSVDALNNTSSFPVLLDHHVM
jgi:hypothetical protein